MRGQEIIKDLREPTPFHEGMDVKGRVGHDFPEGIEKGEAVDSDHKLQKVFAFPFSRLRPADNISPGHTGFMGTVPEEEFEHPGSGTRSGYELQAPPLICGLSMMLEKGWESFLCYGSYAIAYCAGTGEVQVGFRPPEGFELGDDPFFRDPEGSDLFEIFA